VTLRKTTLPITQW